MEVRPEPFAVGLLKNPIQPQPPTSNMRLTFTSDGNNVYKQVLSAPPPYQNGGAMAQQPSQQHRLSWASEDPVKRKRGRPKKYSSEGAMNLASMPMQPLSAAITKKAQGRPRVSLKKHQMSGIGSAGTGFTAHVLSVKASEDVSSVIMSSLQHGSRALCILSANGAISNVTLRQAATPGGTVTYEGRYEILSLSRSFLLSEGGGQRSRTGALSISLAGPDGRVLGGGVAGLLTAASPVQVVVGCFTPEQKREIKDGINPPEPGFSPRPVPASNVGASSSPSRGTLSGSSGGPGSPPHQNAGYHSGSQRPLPSMPSWK